jgi:hypothetical protein
MQSKPINGPEGTHASFGGRITRESKHGPLSSILLPMLRREVKGEFVLTRTLECLEHLPFVLLGLRDLWRLRSPGGARDARHGASRSWGTARTFPRSSPVWIEVALFFVFTWAWWCRKSSWSCGASWSGSACSTRSRALPSFGPVWVDVTLLVFVWSGWYRDSSWSGGACSTRTRALPSFGPVWVDVTLLVFVWSGWYRGSSWSCGASWSWNTCSTRVRSLPTLGPVWIDGALHGTMMWAGEHWSSSWCGGAWSLPAFGPVWVHSGGGDEARRKEVTLWVGRPIRLCVASVVLCGGGGQESRQG